MNEIYSLTRNQLVCKIINKNIHTGGPISEDQFIIKGVETVYDTNRSVVTIEGVSGLTGTTHIQVVRRSFKEILGTDVITITDQPINSRDLFMQIYKKYNIRLTELDVANSLYDFSKGYIHLDSSPTSILYLGSIRVEFEEYIKDISDLIPPGIAAELDYDLPEEGKLNSDLILRPMDVSNIVLHLASLKEGDMIGYAVDSDIAFQINHKTPAWTTDSKPGDYNLKGALVVSNVKDTPRSLVILKLNSLYNTKYSGHIALIYK